LNLPNLDLVELDYQSALEIADYGKQVGLKGMDTIIVYTARTYGAALVTLDQEIKTKVAKQVTILDGF
jgi:predicted nucleic acid-binding protein